MADKQTNIVENTGFTGQQLKIIADALTMKEANHNRASNSTKDEELRGIHIMRGMETRQLLMAVNTLQAKATS